MTVNDRIRSARTEQGLSLNALAKKLGVTSTCVWNWDHDNTSPRPDALPRLADALGVNVEWLRNGGDSRKPSVAEPETLDAILTSTRARIASLLSVDASRVGLSFNLDETDRADAKLRLQRAREMVSRLPSRPMSSDEFIGARHASAALGE
jgi:transcriptional regulator with XRE-family HTH domain